MAKVQFKTSFFFSLILCINFILYAVWELTDRKPNAGWTDRHICIYVWTMINPKATDAFRK